MAYINRGIEIYQYLYERPSAQAYGIGQCQVGGDEYRSDGVSWTLGSGSGVYTSSVINKPISSPTGTDSGIAGNLNGTYGYFCSYVTEDGETEVNNVSSSITVASKKVNLTNIPISTSSNVIARKIYRSLAADSSDITVGYLVTTINDNTTTTYVDDIAEGSLGAQSQRINTTGGLLVLDDSTIGAIDSSTTAIGYNSMYLGLAYASTAYGVNTLTSNTGKRNSAFGMYGLYSNTTGSRNCAFGVLSLNYNLIGTDLSAFGYGAGMNTTGSYNTAVGAYALYVNITGTQSCAFGFNALKNSTANHNVGVGAAALSNLSSGQGNIGIGSAAGNNLANGTTPATGMAFCTFIGYDTRAQAITDVNSVVIGYAAIGRGTNSVVLGSDAVTQTYLKGGINLNKTVTAAGTTGAQTINNPTGSVNFAAAAASLVVTNSLVTANSVIQLTVGTNDATMKSAIAVAGTGSFTIYPNANPIAETRVNFTITN